MRESKENRAILKTIDWVHTRSSARWLKSEMERTVYEQSDFQDHITETAKACGVEREVAEFVIKHYTLNVNFTFSIIPKEHIRITTPAGMIFRVYKATEFTIERIRLKKLKRMLNKLKQEKNE